MIHLYGPDLDNNKHFFLFQSKSPEKPLIWKKDTLPPPERNYTLSLELLRHAEAQKTTHDPFAILYRFLGLHYSYGYATPINLPSAMEYYKKSFSLGYQLALKDIMRLITEEKEYDTMSIESLKYAKEFNQQYPSAFIYNAKIYESRDQHNFAEKCYQLQIAVNSKDIYGQHAKHLLKTNTPKEQINELREIIQDLRSEVDKLKCLIPPYSIVI
ncbi:MAG: hypothetical protein Harvfovirus6_2 [Harvfovirus sp.]|uniref:Sel1 repeat family protein n=1 Tax=Harvfovirus sp. TaxID=2487768 RepID=A0A3G5A0Q5_9VIRU|nr:MAG: hypothetical protein Harvfovirus6_2 [Harvfovirus sp.]